MFLQHNKTIIILTLSKIRNKNKFITCAEAVAQMGSVKNVFLKFLQNSQENTCARASFLIKLPVCKFIKNEILAQVFSLNFANFLEHPFYRTLPDDCF